MMAELTKWYDSVDITGLGRLEISNGVFTITFTLNSQTVMIEDECHGRNMKVMSPADATTMLQEAIDWIKEQTDGGADSVG